METSESLRGSFDMTTTSATLAEMLEEADTMHQEIEWHPLTMSTEELQRIISKMQDSILLIHSAAKQLATVSNEATQLLIERGDDASVRKPPETPRIFRGMFREVSTIDDVPNASIYTTTATPAHHHIRLGGRCIHGRLMENPTMSTWIYKPVKGNVRAKQRHRMVGPGSSLEADIARLSKKELTQEIELRESQLIHDLLVWARLTRDS